MKTISFKLQKAQAYPVSCNLYGVCLEDTNFAFDGGLNANMVVNYSFDGLYYDKKTKKALSDPLRYWHVEGTEAESVAAGQITENTRFASFYVKDKVYLANFGYNGHDLYAKKPAMSIVEGHNYDFSVRIRGNYKGTVKVSVTDLYGKSLSSSFVFEIGKEWENVNNTLKGLSTEYGKLEMVFEGHGYVDMDMVSLMDADYWGRGETKWSCGKMRKDIVSALSELRPAFLRFPGGSVVEGKNSENEYIWKNTVGPLENRKATFNAWGEKVKDGGYSQSYQIGFYELLLLCEDLQMEPVPTLSVGLQGKNAFKDSEEEEKRLIERVIGNYLDLIDFCKANPKENVWAKLRADMGHPEPFGLHMICVGDENFGPIYHKRFEKISQAVSKVHPEIRLIYSSGIGNSPSSLASSWKRGTELNPGGWIDEHLYRTPNWFIHHHHHYDRYERCSTKVIISEFSASRLSFFRQYPVEKANSFKTALAEAAFLTNIERNADLVDMISYSPMLGMVGGTHFSGAMIEFNPGFLLRSANFQVLKEFSTHFGENYVPIKAALPSGVFASASMDGNSVYLKIVNTTAATYGASIFTPDMSHIFLAGRQNSRNIIGFKGEGVCPLEWKKGFVNPSRDEVDGKRIKREDSDEKQCLSLLLPHSVNLFVMEK